MKNDLTHLSKKVVAAESNKQQHQTAKNTCILLLIHNLEAIVLVDRFVIVLQPFKLFKFSLQVDLGLLLVACGCENLY